MSTRTFSELLKAAKAAPRPTREVTVTVAGEPVALKLTMAAGNAWAEHSSRYPARAASPLDRKFGYNLQGFINGEGWRWVQRKDGDQWVDFARLPAVKERALPAVDEWAEFMAALSGHDAGLVIDVFFDLNVWTPQVRREAAEAQRAALAKEAASTVGRADGAGLAASLEASEVTGLAAGVDS